MMDMQRKAIQQKHESVKKSSVMNVWASGMAKILSKCPMEEPLVTQIRNKSQQLH